MILDDFDKVIRYKVGDPCRPCRGLSAGCCCAPKQRAPPCSPLEAETPTRYICVIKICMRVARNLKLWMFYITVCLQSFGFQRLHELSKSKVSELDVSKKVSRSEGFLNFEISKSALSKSELSKLKFLSLRFSKSEISKSELSKAAVQRQNFLNLTFENLDFIWVWT